MFLNLTAEKEWTDRVKHWIKFVSEGAEKFDIDQHRLVSDTIVAGAKNNEEGLKKLLCFSKYMLEEGVKKSFCLRGAISFGDVNWNTHNAYGKAVVEAFTFANNLDWIGTACLANIIDNNSSLWTSGLIVNYMVPIKEGELIILPTVIWNIPTFEELIKLTTIHGLFPIGVKIPVKSSYYNKIQNTALYSHYIKKVLSYRIHLNQAYYPLEVAVSNSKDIKAYAIEKTKPVERTPRSTI